jgi:hypothetical protein
MIFRSICRARKARLAGSGDRSQWVLILMICRREQLIKIAKGAPDPYD